jgi:tRNA U55 pseudouridine synthase TruB
MSSR